MKELCQKTNKNRRVGAKTSLTSLAALTVSALASNTIAAPIAEESQVKTTSSTKSVVHMNFSKPVKSDPKVSVLTESNQIILDFTGVDRTFNPPIIENDPLISKVSTKLVDNKVRMVFETKQPVKFKFVKQGEQGIFFVEESSEFINDSTGEKYTQKSSKSYGNLDGLTNNWSNVSTNNAVGAKTDAVNAFTEINRINLKKEGNRTTKLTVDVNGKLDNPTLKKEGSKLIMDFKNVSIPNELQRRVNTENVGSMTQALDVSMQQSNGRIILEQKEGWDYSFYQVQNQFVVEVKPVDKVEEEKKYIGKPLSISFQDMEVRAILQVIADFTGLNIMSSDKVSGTMSIRLKDVPWDQALDLVLESRGLQKVKDGNVIWIATSQEVAENNKAKIDLRNQNEELGELKLEFFQVNYYKAEDLKKVIENVNDANAPIGAANSSSSGKKTFLSAKGSVGVDVRNNVLFIQDTEEKLKEIRKLIKKLDVANKQVLVEAKIVIADSDFGRNLGAKFGVKYNGKRGNGSYGIGGTLSDSGALATGVAQGNGTAIGQGSAMYGPFGQQGNYGTNSVLSNLAASAIGATPAGAIALTLLNASQNGLGIELSALEANNKGKVLSNPRLLTADNKKAVIEQGSEIPYVKSGGANNAPTLEFKKAVLKLEVTPQIAPNGKVVMDLNIRKDSVGQYVPVAGGGTQPTIDTKNIQTTVTVNNGQTVVLGGVYEISSTDDLQKIPFLGDIPFLGNLFKQKSNTESKGELMIFITPYVVEEADLDSGEPEKSPEINLAKK